MQTETLLVFSLKGTSILGSLLLLGENKLQLNYQEIGSQLVIVPSGFGTLCMQGDEFISQT